MIRRSIQSIDPTLLRHSLRLFLPIAGALSLVLVPMVVLYEHTRRSTLEARVQATVDAGSLRVQSTLEEIVADSGVAAALLERLPGLGDRRQRQELLNTFLRADGSNMLLAVDDATGPQAFTQVSRGAPPALGESLPAAMQRGRQLAPKQYWMSPVVWPIDAPPSMLTVRPLHGPTGQRLGVLLLVTSLEPLLRDLSHSMKRASAVQRGFLVSGAGRLLSTGSSSGAQQSLAALQPGLWQAMQRQSSGSINTGGEGLFVFERAAPTNDLAVVVQVEPGAFWRSSAFAHPAGQALVALLYLLAAAVSVGITAYQRKLAALRSVERQTYGQLQAVMRTSGVGMGLCDPTSGRFLFANPALCDLLSCSEAKLLANNWQQILLPEDRPATQELLERLQQGEPNSHRLRRRFLRSDGSSGWGDLLMACSRQADGTIADLVIQLLDVSELVEQRAYLEAAAEAGIVGVWDWDVKRNQMTWDAVMFRLYGRSADRWTAAYDTWAGALHPDDRERVEADVKAAIEGWRPFQPSFRVIWPDGSIHHLQARSRTSYGADGAALRMIGVNYDISEAVQRSQEVEEQRQLLATTLNALMDPLLFLTREADALNLPRLRIADLNPAASSFFSRSRSKLVGQQLAQVLPEALNGPIHAALLATASGSEPLLVDEQPLQLAEDAALRYVDIRAVATADGLVVSVRDVSARRQAGRQLAASEERFRLLAENSGDVVLWLAGDGEIRWVSPSLSAALGWEPEEWIGRSGNDFLIHKGEDAQYKVNLEQLRQGDSSVLARDQVRASDGSIHWVETHACPYRNAAGEQEGMVASFRVIDAVVEAEQQLSQSEQRYRLLAENARDVIWTMEIDGSISYVSPSIWWLRGITPAEAMAQTIEEILPPESRLRSQAYFQQLLADLQADRPPQPFRGELEYYRKDGSTIWTEVIALPVMNGEGSMQHLLGVSRDISDRKHFELQLLAANQQLNELAATDSLTSIWNRRYLETAIQQAIERSDRYAETLSMVLCDIDHFKLINDHFGHPSGDQVLIEFCHRIRQHLRGSDLLGRWGGEEFLILLPHSHLSAGRELAEKLRQLIADSPFPSVGNVTASFGVAQRHQHEPAESWLGRTDASLYAAKAAGRNAVGP